mmetsp:Transcript_106551/g.308809  ORF Transcript_106551/g.308809 Transcript_106551/m.308809 type:complete len:231 (+) Transcript_106551:203-895(+)
MRGCPLQTSCSTTPHTSNISGDGQAKPASALSSGAEDTPSRAHTSPFASAAAAARLCRSRRHRAIRAENTVTGNRLAATLQAIEPAGALRGASLRLVKPLRVFLAVNTVRGLALLLHVDVAGTHLVRELLGRARLPRGEVLHGALHGLLLVSLGLRLLLRLERLVLGRGEAIWHVAHLDGGQAASAGAAGRHEGRRRCDERDESGDDSDELHGDAVDDGGRGGRGSRDMG